MAPGLKRCTGHGSQYTVSAMSLLEPSFGASLCFERDSTVLVEYQLSKVHLYISRGAHQPPDFSRASNVNFKEKRFLS
jgi:hypothetical protein